MTTHAAFIDLDEGAAPATPAAGRRRVYAKTDGVYEKDDAGTESAFGTDDPAAFVGCRVFHNTTQSMPDTGAGADVIDFNTEDFDTDAIHDAGTPSAFTVPTGKDGKWRFDPAIFLPAGTAIQVRLQARINGTPVNPELRFVRHATLSITLIGSITLELAAGDDVDFLFNQGSGGNVTIGSATASANNYLEATFLGA